MNPLAKLQDSITERKYSRKGIRKKLREEILGNLNDGFGECYHEAVKLLTDWLNKPAVSKQGKPWLKRQVLKDVILKKHDKGEMKIEDIVVEAMLIIMPTQYSLTIQTIAGRLGNFLELGSPFDNAQMAAEMVCVMADADLYTVILAEDSETGTVLVKTNWAISDELMDFIANTQYLPPMMSKPNFITRNFDQVRVTQKESMILKGDNHHNLPICLKNLNMVNSIEYSLDTYMLGFEEENTKELDTPEKVINFNRLKAASREVYNYILDNGNSFFMPWKYDKRGREYSQGYHVHIQATEYKKSLINFAKKELITK